MPSGCDGVRNLSSAAAYIYGSPKTTVPDEYAKMWAENDWKLGRVPEAPAEYTGAPKHRNHLLGSSAGFTYVIANGPIADTDTMVFPFAAPK